MIATFPKPANQVRGRDGTAPPVLALATAPNAVEQPQRATVAFRLTASEAAKYGLSDRWQAAINRRQLRAQKRKAAAEQLNALAARLVTKAQAEEWSERKFAAKTGIPATTFRRIRAGQVDPFKWLPALRAAAARLIERNNGIQH
jgi:hypothetical protein